MIRFMLPRAVGDDRALGRSADNTTNNKESC